jgi:hypothetical protein
MAQAHVRHLDGHGHPPISSCSWLQSN